MIVRRLLAAMLLAAAAAASAPAARAGDIVLADFEDAGGAPHVGVDQAATRPSRCYTLTVRKPCEIRLDSLRLDTAADLTRFRALAARVRVKALRPMRPVALRWVGLNAHGQVIRMRLFEVTPGQQWQTLTWPLYQWRAGHDCYGPWREVRELALQAHDADFDLSLDDIVLIEGDARECAHGPGPWLTQLAFDNRAFARAQAPGVVVLTDAGKLTTPKMLDDLAGRMAGVRRLLLRLIREADEAPQTRPDDPDEPPVPLLIFAKRSDYVIFFNRLGRLWNVSIAEPTGGGYTVQDIAASYVNAPAAPLRPVYIHEATHALVGRCWGLPSGLEGWSWLHEGLANYVQLCLYPQALSPQTYRKAFASPIDPSGQGFFKPLDRLVGSPMRAENYAQAASLAAFLIDSRPELLGDMIRGHRRGQDLSAALKRHHTSWPQIESQWMQWGRRRFVEGPAREIHFDLPPELRP